MRDRLRNFSLKVADRVSRAAARAGGAVLLKEARKRIPRDTGTLRKSLIQKVQLNRRDTGHDAIIGAKRPGSRYLHLVDQSTRAHTIPGGQIPGVGWRRGIRHPGGKGSRTLEKVIASKSGEATAAYAKKAAQTIERLT